MEGFDLRGGELVVTADDYLLAQLPKVLDEVIGEGVVVVEDEDHGQFQVYAEVILGGRATRRLMPRSHAVCCSPGRTA